MPQRREILIEVIFPWLFGLDIAIRWMWDWKVFYKTTANFSQFEWLFLDVSWRNKW